MDGLIQEAGLIRGDMPVIVRTAATTSMKVTMETSRQGSQTLFTEKYFTAKYLRSYKSVGSCCCRVLRRISFGRVVVAVVPGEGSLSPHGRQRTLCSLVVINIKISFSARGADHVLR